MPEEERRKDAVELAKTNFAPRPGLDKVDRLTNRQSVARRKNAVTAYRARRR